MDAATEDLQREAVLALIPVVGDLLDALETYIERLGDDGGVRARIARQSHYGLFEPRVGRLYENWREHEPKIHDEAARQALASAGLRDLLETLAHLKDAEEELWDSTVRAMHARANRLDGALRRAAGAPARDAGIAAFLVPGFVIGDRLGFGGYGEVWAGHEDSPLKIRRAIKVLRPSPFLEDPNTQERFLREAQALLGLSHPNIVPYIATGWTEGAERLLYVVMGLINGQPLREASLAMASTAKVTAMAEVLDALDYAHSQQVFHRDVKPSNIMMRYSDNQPILVDYGLVAFGDADSELTTSVLGSPGYIPSEVLADPGQSRGPNHDIYSVGVTLYEILTGTRPDVRDYRPVVDDIYDVEGLDPIIQKSLAKRSDRFSTAGSFAQALRAWLRGEPIAIDGINLEDIQTAPFRDMLAEAAAASTDENTVAALILVAGVYEAMRISWARAARRSGGVDLQGKERFLPATISMAALTTFPETTGYYQAPSLANDKYGPPSLLSMGFTPTEQSRLRALVELAEEFIRRKKEWPLDDVEIDAEDVAGAIGTIGAQLLKLESGDPIVFAPTDETV